MLLQIFYFIPAILGTLFIAVGLYHGSKFYSLTWRCTQEGMGTLLGFEEKKMKSGTLYYPVVRFTSQDGKTHRARYAFGNAEWNYVAGDELPLRYNPENPEEIYLHQVQSLWQQYASPVFIILGGIIFMTSYYFIL